MKRKMKIKMLVKGEEGKGRSKKSRKHKNSIDLMIKMFIKIEFLKFMKSRKKITSIFIKLNFNGILQSFKMPLYIQALFNDFSSVI